MNYNNWLIYASNKLSHIESNIIDAEILLQYVVKKSKSYIIAFDNQKINMYQLKILEDLLSRRAMGEPIAYLIGKKEFWSLSFDVSKKTLIPRCDTECMIEKVLYLFSGNERIKILDLGTGSGAIAISIGKEISKSIIIGVDVEDEIIDVARVNAKRLLVNNVFFYKSNWFESISFLEKFDIIVSNPPYICKNDPCLDSIDLKFEPKLALVAEDNGFASIHLIIKKSCNYLKNKGWLFLEHGFLQGYIVRLLFSFYNYKNISTFCDYGGRERITIGQLK